MDIIKDIKELNEDVKERIFWEIFSVLDANCNTAWSRCIHAESYEKDRWRKKFQEACDNYLKILGRLDFLK